MKVSQIRTFVTGAGRRNWVLVQVRTDGGIEGWGEATLETREQTVQTCVHELGAALVGEDPLAVERHWQRLYRRFWRGGVVLGSALSALDQALWDIRGRAWGVPVYELLGGPVRDRIRLYTHVGMYEPQRMEREARSDVADGFTAVKTGAWLDDSNFSEAERLAAVSERVGRLRDVVGPAVDIMFDNHGRSRGSAAVRLLEALAPQRPLWVEEPTPPEELEALARVRSAVPGLDLAAGERLYTKWDFLPLLERRVIDFAQPDVCHAGGITEVRKIAAMAEAHGVWLAPHNPQGPASTAACAHLGMAVPGFAILEFVRHPLRDRLLGEGWTVTSGHLHVPPEPGLGAQLDERLLESPARKLRTPPISAADGSVADP
jgi:galactonate dehydratase